MRRFEALDGWRGVCALGVALNHVWFLGHYRTVWAVNNFHLFVDYFFVLSGFVITHAYSSALREWGDVGSYVLRRLGRIYPLHLVTLGVFVAYEAAQVLFVHLPTQKVFSGPQDPWYILSNILMLQGMGVDRIGSWNGPSWSISVEFFLYILFSFIFLTFRGKSFPLACAIISLVGAIIIRIFAPHVMDSTFDFGFARGLYGFFLGCIICLLVNRYQGFRLRFGTACEAAILLVISLFLSLVDRGYWSMLATPIFAVAIWVFAHEEGRISAVLRSRVGRALGRWSFSIYLWHYVLLYILFGFLKFIEPNTDRSILIMSRRASDGSLFKAADFGSPFVNDLAAAAMLSSVILIAAISYRFIEKPGMAYFKRLAQSTRKDSKKGLALCREADAPSS